MTRLQVETADFHEAATTLRHDVAEAVRICLDGLSFSPELVGEDPAGESWSAAYDDAARTILRATAQLSNAAARVSLLLAHSGHNYARADAASRAGGGEAADFGELLRPLPIVKAPAMPRSGGAGNGNPSGWWIIEHTIGYVWPGGHQERLRTTAAEWRAAAGGIENVAFEPVLAVVAFARDRLPEADDIATLCRGLNNRLADLARSYRTLADSCEQYAEHLDQCHTAVRDELSDLVRDSAVTQGTGAALAVLTLGGSEVAAQATQAARITLAASRVTSLIERMITAARRIAGVLERVHTAAQEIDNATSSLVNIPVVLADVTRARNITRVGSTHMAHAARNEAAAAGRLAQGVRIKRRLTKAERKHILDGDSPTSGGHRYPGSPGKATFPEEWSDDQIIGNVEDIVKSDRTTWHVETGNGGLYTNQGDPARWRAWEVRDGKRIRVSWEPATGHVRTAFPDPETPTKGITVP